MATQKVINFPDTKKEIWKPIKGYEGRYAISNRGRVKSLSRIVRCKNRTDFRINEKILSPGDNGCGYLQVNLSKDHIPNVVCIHRLVAETFIPNPNNKRTVNHKDGDKKNNCADNLEWSTYSENHNHAYKNNLMIRGKGHHYARLDENDVRDIRRKYAGDGRGGRKYKNGKTSRELAEEYNVSQEHIVSIVKFRKWKHVK